MLGLVAVAGCGGGESQDENEPDGEFTVQVVNASFPERQRLAERSTLAITVRNAGRETIPNVAVTVDGLNYEESVVMGTPDEPRQRFAINGEPVSIGGFPDAREAAPRGCDTAYVGTWACGPLRRGAVREFRWSVTAVVPGAFRVAYRVDAGLHGNATAVTASGEPARGAFVGTVSGAAPQSRIAENGETVVTEPR